MTAQMYIEHILAPVGHPFYMEVLEALGICQWQQDSAPCHTAKLAKEWMAEAEMDVLPWPSQSPDMNPIEHN
jgi:hypothetical protein